MKAMIKSIWLLLALSLWLGGNATVHGQVTNTPPPINIINPTNGVTYTNGVNLELGAQLGVTNTPFSQIEFFNGTNSLGVLTNSPYTLTVTNLPTGTNTITAVLTQPGGVLFTSTPVNVIGYAASSGTNTNTAPFITIINPTNNVSFTNGSNLQLSAELMPTNNPFTQVQFFNGTNLLGTVTNTPFNLTVTNLPSGSNSIIAVVTQPGGLPYTSAPITIVSYSSGQVTNTNAPISIAGLTNGMVLGNGQNVQLGVQLGQTNQGITQVEYFNGTNSLGIVTNAPYQLMLNLLPGTNVIKAVLTQAGGIQFTSEPVTITVAEPMANGLADPIPQRILKGNAIIDIQKVAEGMVSPVGLAAPDDGSGRLFVADQIGLVYVLNTRSNATSGAINPGGSATNAVLLDVRNRLVTLQTNYDERGLIGIAAHPNFAQHPLLYTYTSEPIGTNTNGSNIVADFQANLPAGEQYDHQNVLAEWRMGTNGNGIDLNSRREILRVDQPQANHNAGTLRFGPDGFLYLSLGDGGGEEDIDGQLFNGKPMVGHGTGNAQNLNRIYGKLIRIDVHGTNSLNGNYGIPTNNVFVGGSGQSGTSGLPEIYAYGFRNPYSYSFDRLTGEIYLGDVGGNFIEEIDRVVPGGNYGWNLKEGSFFFNQNGTNVGYITEGAILINPLTGLGSGGGTNGTSTNGTSGSASNLMSTNLIDPIAEYDHDEGRAVIGGFVYRGTNVPALYGKYMAGDLLYLENPSGRVFYLEVGNTNSNTNGVSLNSSNAPESALHEIQIGLEDRPLGMLVKGFGEDQNGELYVLGSAALGPGGNSGKVLKIVNPQSPIIITNIQAASTNVTFGWTGGNPPYFITRRTDPVAGEWSIANFTTDNFTTVPAVGNFGFFEINSAAYLQATPLTAVLLPLPSGSPTSTNGTGTGMGGGIASLMLEGDVLSFTILYSNLTGVATSAFIGIPTTETRITNEMINLQPYGTLAVNGSFSGSVRVSPVLKTYLLAGKAFIRLLTAGNQGGEVQGQIATVLMQADLSGANERPMPVLGPGVGSAHFLLTGKRLTMVVTYHGLTGPAIMAHIHGPATAADAASVMVPLNQFISDTNSPNGSLSGTVTLSDEVYTNLINGLTYVNIHTTNHPNGEIRGQILPVALAYPFTASINSGPMGTGTGNNNGLAIFSLAGNLLSFDIGYSNLNNMAIGGSVLNGTNPPNAAATIELQPYIGGNLGSNGIFSGKLELTPEQKLSLLNGNSSLSLSTGSTVQGSAQGSITPVARQLSLNGSSVMPLPVSTSGTGSGTVWVVGNEADFVMAYNNLSSNANAAGLFTPGTTPGIGNVFLDLAPYRNGNFGTAGSFSGNTTLTPDQLNSLNSGQPFVSISTTQNNNGEIRGNVTP